MQEFSKFGLSLRTNRQSPMVFFADYLEDVDDVFAAIGAMGLSHLSHISIGGVCVSTDPTDIRSQAGRGLWDRIGGTSVPLACGRGRHDNFWTLTCPWLKHSEFLSAKTFLFQYFSDADDKSLTVVAMAPVTDLAEFIMEHKELFQRKTMRVVIMGEVLFEGSNPKLVNGLMVSGSAKNLFVNKSAGEFVVKMVQQLEIPTTFLTRHAAMTASIPLTTWDKIGTVGGEVGTWLAKGVRHHLNAFWFNCNLPLDHPTREEQRMPPRQDRAWFINVILCNHPEANGRTQTDRIDDLALSIPVYDLLAVIAACDELIFKFFQPFRVTIGIQEHLIIGHTKEDHGVRNQAELIQFMTELVFFAFEKAVSSSGAFLDSSLQTALQ